MKSIVVKFEFSNQNLEGYEDCIDELIIDDFLCDSGIEKQNVSYQILAQQKDSADLCLCRSIEKVAKCEHCKAGQCFFKPSNG